MPKRGVLIIFCLQSCFLLHAQERKLAITLSPAIVSMPDWYLAIQPGIQYQLSSRINLGGELCLPIVAIHRNSTISSRTFFRFRGELKYYLHPRSASSYISLESSYALRSFSVSNCAYFSGKKYDSAFTYQRADVHSPIWITNIKLGREFILGAHFRLDVFAGLGFRNMNTRYNNVEGLAKEVYMRPSCKIFPSPDAAWWYEANLYRFNATMGFRFMYQF